MDDLAAQFLARLRERIATLSEARRNLGAAPELRVLIRSMSHALKGAGGTYGYPELSAAAAAVESAPEDALASRLDALLDVLHTVVARGPGARAAAPGAAAASPARGGEGRQGPAGATAVRLLVVDDDPDISRLLEQALAAPGRRIEVADSAAALRGLVAVRDYDLIVLDLLLPDADGRTLLAELRRDPGTARVPIIVLSGLQSAGAKAECFMRGADAYIEKPFDPMVVAAAVGSKLERMRHLRPDARVDPLTSLPNAAAFREAFERATADARGQPLALALLELDQHAALAATAGWGSAERALALAAQALAKALKGAEPLAHWSGATLAALMPGRREADAAAALGCATAAAGRLAAAPPADRYTFSAGVVEWTPGASLDETIADVERRVLAAKAAGGATVTAVVHAGAATTHTILLAEDDDLIAALVKHRLAREGMTVERVADGLSALDAATKFRPALAILDVKMPGMDGFEVLARLRADQAFCRMPILMLTSLGSEQDIVRGLGLGADEYVVKPFSPVELLARVRRLLARS